jgi:hypothetical protein
MSLLLENIFIWVYEVPLQSALLPQPLLGEDLVRVLRVLVSRHPLSSRTLYCDGLLIELPTRNLLLKMKAIHLNK